MVFAKSYACFRDFLVAMIQQILQSVWASAMALSCRHCRSDPCNIDASTILFTICLSIFIGASSDQDG